jgi:hypothetical protein
VFVAHGDVQLPKWTTLGREAAKPLQVLPLELAVGTVQPSVVVELKVVAGVQVRGLVQVHSQASDESAQLPTRRPPLAV